MLREEIDVSTNSPWLGFDDGPAVGCMTQLIEQGFKVVIATKRGSAPARLPADRRQAINRRRKKATFLAIEPRLLIDEKTVESVACGKWLKRRGYEQLFEQFQTWLVNGERRLLRDYGELYVYRVGDWYEIDQELTSMLDSHVLLLASAAVATGCRMPCRLVEPRPRRQRRPCQPTHVETQPVALGQLRFEEF